MNVHSLHSLEEIDARPPEFTDEALALRFAEIHEHDLRYVAAWGKWFEWTGTHWRVDDTLHAFDLGRRVCRLAAAECNKPNIASAVAASPEGECPLFRTFLQTVTGRDVELENYLGRVFGYGLTGLTRDHALFFGHGSGANGKSVLLSTVARIMGLYHRTAPVETFTASAGDKHPTDLAMLRGARLVTAVETEEGRRWAESRIKQLTGGDAVAARFMRQDFFEYTPAFKLVIAGNHKPSLRSVDESIRRRFHLIPFAVTIPPNRRDPELTEKLKDEWSGILAWMMDGCLRWQERGLDPPKAVRDATDAYLEAEDAFAAWFEEKCEREIKGWETSADLFASWKMWAEAAGESPGQMKRFVQQLELHCVQPSRRKTARGFAGVILRKGDERSWWNKD